MQQVSASVIDTCFHTLIQRTWQSTVMSSLRFHAVQFLSQLVPNVYPDTNFLNILSLQKHFVKFATGGLRHRFVAIQWSINYNDVLICQQSHYGLLRSDSGLITSETFWCHLQGTIARCLGFEHGRLLFNPSVREKKFKTTNTGHKNSYHAYRFWCRNIYIYYLLKFCFHSLAIVLTLVTNKNKYT